MKRLDIGSMQFAAQLALKLFADIDFPGLLKASATGRTMTSASIE
jgi:hypothetical protein